MTLYWAIAALVGVSAFLWYYESRKRRHEHKLNQEELRALEQHGVDPDIFHTRICRMQPLGTPCQGNWGCYRISTGEAVPRRTDL